MRKVCWSTIGIVVGLAASLGADEKRFVKPEDARGYVDRECTVEMTVQSSHFSERSETVFLNSEKDYRDPKNFTIVIFKDALARFKDAKIAAPAEHYKGKRIRVTGKVALHRDRPEMKIASPDVIVVLDKPKSAPEGIGADK